MADSKELLAAALGGLFGPVSRWAQTPASNNDSPVNLPFPAFNSRADKGIERTPQFPADQSSVFNTENSYTPFANPLPDNNVMKDSPYYGAPFVHDSGQETFLFPGTGPTIVMRKSGKRI